MSGWLIGDYINLDLDLTKNLLLLITEIINQRFPEHLMAYFNLLIGLN